MVFYFKDVEVKHRENVVKKNKEELQNTLLKQKVWLNFLKIKHANSGISMRNRTPISRERESYH